jgi:hypothetical protein
MTVTYDTTPTVDAIGQMRFSGNVIDRAWCLRPELRLPNGKVNLVAMMLLADCLYWYRPAEKRDEDTSLLITVHKKFSHDKWQINYEAWGNSFGVSKRQVQDAATFLEKAGLITRELRDITWRNNNGTTGRNTHAVFLEPIPAAIAVISTPADRDDKRLFIKPPAPRKHQKEADLSRYNVTGCHVETRQGVTLKREHTREYIQEIPEQDILPAPAVQANAKANPPTTSKVFETEVAPPETSLSNGDLSEIVPPAEKPKRARSAKQQANDALMALVAPYVIGNEDPEAIALALTGDSASHIAGVSTILSGAGITTHAEIAELVAYAQEFHFFGKYNGGGINKTTWAKFVPKYVGWRNSGKPRGATKSSARAEEYREKRERSRAAIDAPVVEVEDLDSGLQEIIW